MHPIQSVKSPEFMMVAAVVTLIILISISGMVTPPAQEPIESFVAHETKIYSQADEELLIRHFSMTKGMASILTLVVHSQNSIVRLISWKHI